MNKIIFIYLSLLFFSVISKAERNIVYQNQFTDKRENTNNITNILDIVRAQVGEFRNHNLQPSIPIKDQDSALSVSFWIKPSNIELHPGTIIGEDSLFNFRYLSNRTLQFNHFIKKDIDTKAVLCNNLWQHIAFTLSPQGQLKIYFEGDCILTDSIQSNWHKQKRIGFSLGTDRYKVNAEGLIDELTIHNTVLSDNEVKDSYIKSKITPALKQQLQAYLPLQADIKNKVGNLTISKNKVQFVTDKAKGDVALFDNDSSIIGLEDFKYDHQITIAAWIKPTNKEWVMSLAGNKDFDFRFTTKNSALWFSVPMLFTNRSRKYKKNNKGWTHIAVAVKYNHEVQYFINGELIDKQTITGKTGKSTSLIIGRSIWGNTFNGSMSQFALWSRALSLEEIQQVYNGKLETISFKDKTKSNSILILISVLILLFIVFFIFIFTKRRKKSSIEKKTTYQAPKSNCIYITGLFKAYDKNGVDISNMFSPTLIRILSLIILYPILKNRRITSSEISDILWENDSASQQKNNRSTNIHRLRKIFEHFNRVELIYKNREWYIEYNSNFNIDIVVIDKHLKFGNIGYLPPTIQLCKPIHTHTFDSIIQEYEERYFGILQALCTTQFQSGEYQHVISLAKLWGEIAPLNDQVIKYLVSSLNQLHRKQEALNYYTQFKVQHKKLLNEETDLSFEQCSEL